MIRMLSKMVAPALGAGIVMLSAGAGQAAPAFGAPALKAAAQPTAETVRWRGYGGWHRHGGWHGGWRGHRGLGWGGFAAGAIIGGALASRYYSPYYAPYPAYTVYPAPPPPVYYGGGYGGGAVAYCMRRFRSYDPVSRTYLGYDGFRHPCP